MRAARLFDPASGTATIPSVLRAAEQNAGKFKFAKPDEVRRKIATWEKRIGGIQSTLKKLHDLRNGLMAHLDKVVILDPQKMTRTVAVTFDEVDQILNVANEILTGALAAYINSVYFQALPSTGDHEELFRNLESATAVAPKPRIDY